MDTWSNDAGFPRGGRGRAVEQQEQQPPPQEDVQQQRRKRSGAHDDDLFGAAKVTRELDAKEAKAARRSRKRLRDRAKVKETRAKEVAKQANDVRNTASSPNAPKRAIALVASKLNVGTVCMASVRKVGSLRVTLSLPHQIKAHVGVTDVSAAYTQLLQEAVARDLEPTPLYEVLPKDQIILCAITEVAKEGRHIVASLDPASVNAGVKWSAIAKGSIVYGAIRSREDHGYVIDFGSDMASGFLSTKSVDVPLALGRPMLFRVLVAPRHGRGVFQLHASPSKVYHGTSAKQGEVPVANLLPGSVYKGAVMKVIRNGLFVNFGGLHFGTVHWHHAACDLTQLSAKYPHGTKMRARVLWTDPVKKNIGLTLLPSFVGSHQMPSTVAWRSSITYGMRTGVDVVAVTPRGIFARLSKASDDAPEEHDCSVLGYIPLRDLDGDRDVEQVLKQFKVGQHMNARVIACHDMDSMVILSTQKEVVSAPFLRASDVRPGTVVSGTVTATSDEGVAVALSPTVTGFCRVGHLADVSTKRSLAGVHVGRKDDYRVLSVNSRRGSVLLTRAHTLVTSPLPIITSLGDAQRVLASKDASDCWVHGWVLKILSRGIVVRFYNKACAFVPTARVAQQFVDKLEDVFQVNQVVKCRLISADVARRSLIASLLPAATESEKATQKREPRDKADTRSLEGVVPVGALAHGVHVVAVNEAKGYATVEFQLTAANEEEEGSQKKKSKKSKKKKSVQGTVTRFRAKVGKRQLADSAAVCNLIWASWGPGKPVHVNLMVHTVKGRVVQLTGKVSIVSAIKAGAWPTDASQIRVGACLPGFVKSWSQWGVFVAIGFNGLLALAHKSEMSDAYVRNAETAFARDTSVCALVSSVDKEAGRVLVTLKHSAVATAGAEDPTEALHRGSLRRLFRLQLAAAKVRPAAAKGWAAYLPGARVTGTVAQVLDIGVVVTLEGERQVMAFVPKPHVPESAQDELSAGASVVGVVLDADESKAVVDVSLLPDLVARFTTLRKPARPSRGTECMAQVQLVKDHVVVLSATLPSTLDTSEPKKQKKQKKKVKVDLSQQQAPILVHAPSHWWNDCGSSAFDLFKVGDTHSIRVQRAHRGERVLATLVKPPPQAYTPPKKEGDAAARADKSGASPSPVSMIHVDDVTVGEKVSGKVVAVQSVQLLVALSKHVTGRLHMTELQAAPESEASRSRKHKKKKKQQQQPALPWGVQAPVDTADAFVHPLAHYAVGDELQNLTVLAKEAYASNKFLPLSHTNPATRIVIDLSAVHDKPSQRVTLDSLNKGDRVWGYVHTVSKDCIWMHVGPYVRGRVFALQVSQDPCFLADLVKRVAPGMGAWVRVLSVDPAKRTLDLSMLPPPGSPGAAAAVEPGNTVLGRVDRVVHGARGHLRVQLGAHLYARVHLTDFSDWPHADPFGCVKRGDLVWCHVLTKERRGNSGFSVDASLRESLIKPHTNAHVAGIAERAAQRNTSLVRKQAAITSVEQLKPDQVVVGWIQGTTDAVGGSLVTLGHDVVGRITFKELDRSFVKLDVLRRRFAPGTLVRARVVSVDARRKRVNLSLRPAGEAGANAQASKPGLTAYKVGDKVAATVRGVTDFGVFLTIEGSRNVSGLVHRTEVFDPAPKGKRLPALDKAYEVGDYVKAVVLSVDEARGRISFGLKPSYFTAEDMEEESSEEAAGEVEEEEEEEDDASANGATVTGLDDLGVIQRMSYRKGGKSSNNGKQQAHDDAEEEEEDEDSSSASGSGIRLTLEPLLEDDESSGNDALIAAALQRSSDNSMEESEDEGDSSDEEQEDSSSLDASSDAADDATIAPPVLSAGFGWTAVPAGKRGRSKGDDEDSDSDDDSSSSSSSSGLAEDEVVPDAADHGSKKKRRKQAAAEEEEAHIAEVERELMEGQRVPQTDDDFRRLLLATPNSSFVWIKFIAAKLSAADVDGARAIAEEALTKINFREEAEKRNVWVVYLNLENMYGTPATLKKVFKRACTYNDAYEMHTQLASIYESSEQDDAAEAVFLTMLKKFGARPPSYYRLALFYVLRKRTKEFRQLLQRALSALPPQEHVMIISKFAQMEFKHGSVGRGRTMFESLLDNYPKRIDMLSVYIDMEVRVGDKEVVQKLFERATDMRLSTKKMKFFYKKWLRYLAKHDGDPEDVAYVKGKARAYVESLEQ